jgi:hypothetical protein
MKTVRISRSARTTRTLVVLLCGVLASPGCVQKLTREITPPEDVAELDVKSSFLKAHMADGQVYVLSDWRVEDDTVRGTGDLRDMHRRVVATEEFAFPVDSVALFETNRRSVSPSVVPLTILTIISLGATAYCAANPKACFGSCPTFYVDDGKTSRLQAEGFSSSVSPALEARDIDALYRARPSGDELELRMTNEALETHVVRYADVLALPRPADGRVFATSDGEFREAARFVAASRCDAEDGDCREAVRAFDGIERFSLADSTDLAAREHIELEFTTAPGAELGLVIAARQTLLTTYLFYQALAYMGESAGTWLAALERSDPTALQRVNGVGEMLGGIEVLVEGPQGWVSAGEIRETGPLATDVRVVPTGRSDSESVRIRLRLTRGLWRLDWIALVELGERVEPTRLQPFRVLREGEVDETARQALLDPDDALTTLPGDEYTLFYRLPEEHDAYELFLESKGYYLEWMREEWLKDENPARAAMMLFNPGAALRSLAPEYKRVEPEMEKYFWRSRYVRP